MIMHMLDENGVWVRGWGSGSRYGPTVLRMYLFLLDSCLALGIREVLRLP
jgi:hypothetical protein